IRRERTSVTAAISVAPIATPQGRRGSGCWWRVVNHMGSGSSERTSRSAGLWVRGRRSEPVGDRLEDVLDLRAEGGDHRQDDDDDQAGDDRVLDGFEPSIIGEETLRVEAQGLEHGGMKAALTPRSA